MEDSCTICSLTHSPFITITCEALVLFFLFFFPQHILAIHNSSSTRKSSPRPATMSGQSTSSKDKEDPQNLNSTASPKDDDDTARDEPEVVKFSPEDEAVSTQSLRLLPNHRCPL